MISVEEASQIVKQKLQLVPQRMAAAIRADRAYPPLDRAMMDGIAVSFDAYEMGVREFWIEGIAAAGNPQKRMEEAVGCLEIMTGAPVPIGAELVIPYEHLEIQAGIAKIKVELPRTRGENIHPAGSDCPEGAQVLEAGATLNGPHVGIAASMGIRPGLSMTAKILLISTGDELVEVEEEPLNFQLRRSNVHALKASLELNGFPNVHLAHLPDDALDIAAHFLSVRDHYDVLIYSGGVSKGKFDHLPSVWAELGVERFFHEVAQRPGKPLWFGADPKSKTTVIGLPGNPVSSLVCLHRYVIPNREVFVRLATDFEFKKELTYFLPVKLHSQRDGSLWAEPLKIKNSGEFIALAGSDGFVELPAQQSLFRSGEAFAFYPWRSW